MNNLPRYDDGTLCDVAWPGCYPLFYLDSENSVLCPKCARASDNQEEIPQFKPIAADINYEDSNLYCDNCSKKIESAYGDD